MDLVKLGAALRERREALGIPRTEVARRAGVTPTYIWLVEGARPRKGGEPSRPTQSVLERWSRALGMDERYIRQVLVLAGYITLEEERTEESSADAVSSGVTSRMAQPERPSAHTVSRYSMSAPMMQAGLRSEAGAEDLPAAFAAAPVHFQQPRELQSEVLLDELREVLRLAQSSEKAWEETAELLESFLGWLRFRMTTPRPPDPPTSSHAALQRPQGARGE